MAAKQPSEIAEAAVEAGTAKAHLRWDKVIVGSFLAGAYIAFGGLVAISVSSGLDPATWGTLPTLFMGVAFTLGLILVVIAGSHLLTGNMMLVPISAMRGELTVGDASAALPDAVRDGALLLSSDPLPADGTLPGATSAWYAV